MTARTGSSAKPSNQNPAQLPTLTPELAIRLAAVPRRSTAARRQPAVGEVWLQSDSTPDGWIRCRVVEVGIGSMLLLASDAPTIAQGTWARFATPAGTRQDAEQVRVYPLAMHRLTDPVPGAPLGPVAIECEIPMDPALLSRLTASNA